ncbi:MAG TPA: MBL fold metallo-hydrolase [Thermoanaerobaculia bacterium]
MVADMLLRFFGTKGYVEAKSRTHSGHSAFTVEAAGYRLLCDFGENRRGRLSSIAPDGIFVSHGHPDHAWGLAEGTNAPVFASAETHRLLAEFPIGERVVLESRTPVTAGPFRLTAFPVVHSVRCPCVAARIETPDGVVVYSGDVVSFETAEAAAEALADARVYVGDGSTLTGSLVRRHPGGTLIGHTTVRAQLGWVAKAAVPRAIFSHFGQEPIAMGDQALRKALKELAAVKAPDCRVEAARDGKEFLFD